MHACYLEDAGSFTPPAGPPPALGRFAVVELVGVGGMSEVYLARAPGDRLVVVKRLRAELADDPIATSRFFEEGRLLAMFDHPNIARVYDLERADDADLLVMEYVPGIDLRELVAAAHRSGRPVPLDAAIYIVSQVCAALQHVHERTDAAGRPLDIVHRDVSPANVLLGSDGAVKLCDFGLAKSRDGRARTQHGSLKGTFSYLSPEQCRCESLDRRSDVFSLGVMLFELTTSSRPFVATSDYELLRTIIEDPAPSPSRFVSGYPEALSRIVLRGLAKHPHERYQNAGEMQADLEAFAHGWGLAMSAGSVARVVAGRLAPHPPDDETTRVDGERPASPLATIRTRIRRAAPWAAGAVAAAIAALAMPRLAPAGSALADVEHALAGDAERLGAQIDALAAASRLGLARTAASPLLVAAIGTDAATLHDLADQEHALVASHGEVLEVFQRRDGAMVSLLRLPAEAAPLPSPDGVPLQLASDGRELRVIATAAISGAGHEGAVASSLPVELPALSFAGAHRVQLTGVTPELCLRDDDARAGTEVRVAVPLANAPGPLALVATVDPPAARPSWLLLVQALLGLIATWCLVGSARGLARP